MSDAPVLVVGAGPAGSVTALLLARAGHPVTVVDRAFFPRPKACGECSNPGTVHRLRELGLADAMRALDPGRLAGWDLQAPSGRVVRAGFLGAERSWVIDRSRLDATLLAAAIDAGALFEAGVAYAGIEERIAGRPQVRLRHADGRREVRSTPILVGADGLHSRVRAEAGATAPTAGLRKAALTVQLEGVGLDPGWGRLVLDPRGTIGLAPLDPRGERWTLVYVTRTDTGAREDRVLPDGADALIAQARRQIPQLGSGARAVSRVLGSGPFHRPVVHPWGEGVILVGDAAGYYDPVTGQGIGRALESAQLAAAAILAGGDPRSLRRYGRRLRSARRDGVRVQRAIEQVIRRPALLDRLLPALAATGLLDQLISVTGDLAPASGLWSPTAWPRWARTVLGAALAPFSPGIP